MKTIMQCNFLLLKLNMPNANILFLQKEKRQESTREENNAYFDTSPATTQKSDEPQYCNKNVATPKATDFNYQPAVRTKLRGVATICATYNVSFLCYHDVMEFMY